MSWTGSENERKPQGVCLPPTKPADLRERFTIPACTQVLIQPIDDFRSPWWEHTTKATLGFDKCEGSVNGVATFRELGYFIRVKWWRVVRRE